MGVGEGGSLVSLGYSVKNISLGLALLQFRLNITVRWLGNKTTLNCIKWRHHVASQRIKDLLEVFYVVSNIKCGI